MAQHDGRAGVNHAAVPRGEPDVVHIVHPGELPAVKSKLERRDPERFRDLREPTHYEVGKEFSRAIERWEIGHRGDPGVKTGRTMRPLVRVSGSGWAFSVRDCGPPEGRLRAGNSA
jgi:hypothetical protein